MKDDFWEILDSDTAEGYELRSLVFEDDDDFSEHDNPGFDFADNADYANSYEDIPPLHPSPRCTPQSSAPTNPEKIRSNLRATLEYILFSIARTFLIYSAIAIVVAIILAFAR